MIDQLFLVVAFAAVTSSGMDGVSGGVGGGVIDLTVMKYRAPW